TEERGSESSAIHHVGKRHEERGVRERAEKPHLDRRVLVHDREDDEKERQKQGCAPDRPLPRGWPCLPNRPPCCLALGRLALRLLATVCVVLGARPIPLGILLRGRLDFVPAVVDVDVLVLVPPLFLAAATLLA